MGRKLYQLEGLAAIVNSSPARRAELGAGRPRRDRRDDGLALRLVTVAFLVLLVAVIAGLAYVVR